MSSEILTSTELDAIAAKAGLIRQHIIEMTAAANSGHPAGSLSMADIVAALYFGVMRYDPRTPDWEERDLFFLSNGHTAPVLYAALAEAGFFPLEELSTLRRYGSRLQGHPERGTLPGIESTSGPLGEGLSQAAGFAYAITHLRPQPQRFVYVTMGDGELDEGNIWEAVMFAAKYNLGQLIAFVDRNYIQIDGSTEAVMPLGDVAAKFAAFGWHALEVDGHDVGALVSACRQGQAVRAKPTVIIANTIAGRGVDFMEYDHLWHGKAPNAEQAATALVSLERRAR